jgi:hypothetical protein
MPGAQGLLPNSARPITLSLRPCQCRLALFCREAGHASGSEFFRPAIATQKSALYLFHLTFTERSATGGQDRCDDGDWL